MIIKIRNFDNNGQILTLLGFIIVTSVIIISTLAAEIAHIDIVVSVETDLSLKDEFLSVKETFGDTLNYCISDVYITTENEVKFNGTIEDIEPCFEKIKQYYFEYELQRGYLFDANLNLYWYNTQNNFSSLWFEDIYFADITLFLDNGDSYLKEDALYNIKLYKK